MIYKWVLLAAVVLTAAEGRTIVTKDSLTGRSIRKAQSTSDITESLFDTGGAPFLSNILQKNSEILTSTSTPSPIPNQEQTTVIPVTTLLDVEVALSGSDGNTQSTNASEVSQVSTNLDTQKVDSTEAAPILLSSDNSLYATAQAVAGSTEANLVKGSADTPEIVTMEFVTGTYQTAIPLDTVNTDTYNNVTETPGESEAQEPLEISPNTENPMVQKQTITELPKTETPVIAFINVTFPYSGTYTQAPQNSETTPDVEDELAEDDTGKQTSVVPPTSEASTSQRPFGSSLLETLPASTFHVTKVNRDNLGETIFTTHNFATGLIVRTKYLLPLQYIYQDRILKHVNQIEETAEPKDFIRILPSVGFYPPSGVPSSCRIIKDHLVPDINRRMLYRNLIIDEPNRLGIKTPISG